MKALIATVAIALSMTACSDDSRGRSDEGSSAPGSTASQPSTSAAPTSAAPTTPTSAAGPPPPLVLTIVVTLENPVAVAVRPGQRDLYIAERIGRVRRVQVTGAGADARYDVDPEPVLDISSDVTAGGEQGLLGLAFSPDGTQLYLAFTNTDANQELVRYRVESDGSRADPTSGEQLLVVEDFASNHNGGHVLFGPDGYLYWTMGDGGGAGDPRESGQDPTDLLGSILRIDPLHAGADGTPYSIPADNPFAGGGGAPEVYAYGLRNPWRIAFDRATTDLWIADVGQGDWEEINLAPAAEGRGRGANFGWSVLEGTHPFRGGDVPEGAIGPVHEYDHSDGSCSVTGGFVYRGARIPALAGNYLFGDYCGAALMALRMVDGRAVVAPLGLDVQGLSSFAEDADGELYALSLGGPVYRIDAA